jgi:hypothetical protein
MQCEKISRRCRGEAIAGERFCSACRVTMLRRMSRDRYLVDLTAVIGERPAGWSIDDEDVNRHAAQSEDRSTAADDASLVVSAFGVAPGL